MRGFLWFEQGELQEIVAKFRAKKWGYEARWEADVLWPLAFGAGLAFLASFWLGLIYLWLCKSAVQALNKKRFFDPLP